MPIRDVCNHVAHADLDLLIEKRVIEVMRSPRGRIVHDDSRQGLRPVSGYRTPKKI
jgi:hypothetical protein